MTRQVSPGERSRLAVPSATEMAEHMKVLADAVAALSKGSTRLTEIAETTPDFLFGLCSKLSDAADYFETLGAVNRLAERRIVEAAMASGR